MGNLEEKLEQFEKELESRIQSHRINNPFHPTITHDEPAVYPDEIIVNLYVDLPSEERGDYNREYFDSDRNWVRTRGQDYGLAAMLYCLWQV